MTGDEEFGRQVQQAADDADRVLACLDVPPDPKDLRELVDRREGLWCDPDGGGRE